MGLRIARRECLAREDGLSIVEATIVLLVLSTLAAVIAPSIGDYLNEARHTRAREEVEAIGSALNRMLKDIGETMVLLNGTPAGPGMGPSHAASNRVTMIVSEGDVPTPAVPRAGLTNWDSSNGSPPAAIVTTIAEQLITNNVKYRTLSDMNVTSNFDPSSGATFNSEYGWRGAYLSEPVGPDPWGRRYAVNTEFLGRISGGSQTNFDNDVFVISAGPNRIVDTAFAGEATAPAADDVLYLVSGSVSR